MGVNETFIRIYKKREIIIALFIKTYYMTNVPYVD